MRILHWNDGYFPAIGGIELLVRDLCHAQQAAGHAVTVVARALPGCAAAEEIHGVPVLRRPLPEEELARNPGLLKQQVQACVDFKRRFRPDIVHVHSTYMAGWYHLLSRQAWPCPTVLTLHAPLTLPERIKHRLVEDAGAVAVVSSSLKEDLASLWAGCCDKVHVVHNGLASPGHAPTPLEILPFTAVCLGRMVHEKGFDVALKALAGVPDVRLIVAGDGACLADLKKLAGDLGISSRVDFRGWVPPDGILQVLNEASVVLMPSRWREPFGLVAVQAAQMGRPIIASQVGGLPEVVQAGVTGLLVPPDAPQAMAEALRELKANPQQAGIMGAAARQRALTCFSIARCATDYENLYALAAAKRP